jgi:hypothetical protein
MAKQKFPLQWILGFALTSVVIIVFVLYLLFGGGGETASKETQAEVQHAVRVYPKLKAEYTKAMSNGTLTMNEANSILTKANALTAKRKR